METIDFIVPTYWEVWDVLSRLDLRFIVSGVVVFCVGFVLRRILGGRLMSKKREEIQELRKRLQGAERVLEGEKRPEPEEDIGNGSMDEVVSLETVNHREIEDHDIIEDSGTSEGVEPAELWEMYHRPEHRRVVITRLSGPKNAGARLHIPLSGIEIAPPVVGKCYKVELDDGRLLRTPPLTEISNRYICTHNSLYKIEVPGSEEKSKRKKGIE